MVNHKVMYIAVYDMLETYHYWQTLHKVKAILPLMAYIYSFPSITKALFLQALFTNNYRAV